MLFADDLVLLSSSELNLQKDIYQLNITSQNYKLNISVNKTKVLAFRGPETIRAKIVVEDKILEQINCFNYLGCNVSYIKNEDMRNKINKFNQMCGTIKRNLKNTRKETKLKFYKVMAVPVLLYGSECWTMTKQDEKKIEAAEMRFLRHVAGYTLWDRKRSEDIRKELKIFNLREKIQQHRNNWREHVDRMDNQRHPKLTMTYRPEGRRNIGRPRRRWTEQFVS